MKKILLLLLLMLVLKATAAQAATAASNSGTTMPQTNESNDYYRLEEQLQNQKTSQEKPNVIDNTGKQKTMAPDSTLIITVTKIETNPSAILSPVEIAAITSEYVGKSIGIKDLYQALNEIDDLYAKKGFITAKAILPPQKVTGGVVHIQLVEGHFGQFLPDGNKYTRNSYILERLSEHGGNLVNLNTLEQDLFYFNRTNDVQLRAELKPGQKFGLTDCVLNVEEPANFRATLFCDNEGSINTGEFRYGINVGINSLTGNRDSLEVSPIRTQGTWAGSISYNRPVDKTGTRLGLNYSKNQSGVIAGPFQNLDIKSDETDIGVNLSHPFSVKPNFKFDGYASLYNKSADTNFSGSTLIDYHVNTLSLGVAFQSVDRNGFWYSRYDVSRGESQICDVFYRFNLSAVRQQMLDNDRLLIYRLSGQLANRSLLPSTEEFSIGGMTTVRGFPAGFYSGDQGYNLSLEYNFPVSYSNKVKGLFFIDHGGAFPYKGNGDTSGDYLTSVGLGANFNFNKNLSGKVTIGFPINPPQGQGVRIEYYIQLAL